MFLLKKIISPFFYPLTLCMILMICGLFLLWFTKRQKMGKIVMTMAVIATVILSYGAFPDSILGPLERTYPPLLMEETSGPLPFSQQVRWIVVLGGGHTSDPGLPVTSQISFDALARLTEAVRLYRKLPGVKLILSGGAIFDPVSEAEIYFKTARIMDIPARDLILSDRARDTEEEARLIQDRIGKDPLILVTSAFHMPRAVALFKKRGMNPIPAPAAYMVKMRPDDAPGDFFPSGEGFRKTQIFIHEYLGMLWSKLTGRI
jgi:uncharacterized SAM-binding protein YcdF (DUF218 family)